MPAYRRGSAHQFHGTGSAGVRADAGRENGDVATGRRRSRCGWRGSGVGDSTSSRYARTSKQQIGEECSPPTLRSGSTRSSSSFRPTTRRRMSRRLSRAPAALIRRSMFSSPTTILRTAPARSLTVWRLQTITFSSCIARARKASVPLTLPGFTGVWTTATTSSSRWMPTAPINPSNCRCSSRLSSMPTWSRDLATSKVGPSSTGRSTVSSSRVVAACGPGCAWELVSRIPPVDSTHSARTPCGQSAWTRLPRPVTVSNST